MKNFYINKEDGKKKKKTYFELPVVSDKNSSRNKKVTVFAVTLSIIFVLGSTFFAAKTINSTAKQFSATVKEAGAAQTNSVITKDEPQAYDSNINKSLTIFVLNVSDKKNEAEKVVNKLKNDGFNKVSVQQFIGNKTGVETGVYSHEQTSELTAKNIANKLKLTYRAEHGFTTNGWNIIIMI